MGIILRRPPPCTACRPLGQFEHEGLKHELYFCLTRLHSIPLVDPEWPTVMARFGPGDEEFSDGMGAAETDPALGEARRRVIEQGLYDPKKPLHPGMQQVAHIIARMIFNDLLKADKGAASEAAHDSLNRSASRPSMMTGRASSGTSTPVINQPSENKLLRTAEVARDLGVQPDVFLQLAREAGLVPRKNGRHYLWSEADREVVRVVLEAR